MQLGVGEEEPRPEASTKKRRSVVVSPPAPTATGDLFASQNTDNDTTLVRKIVQDALAAPLGTSSSRVTNAVKRVSKENAENVHPTVSPRRKARGVRHNVSPTKKVPHVSQQDDYFNTKRTAIRPPAETEPTTAFHPAVINPTALTRCAAQAAAEDDDICDMPSTSSLNASVIRRMLDWEQERSLMKSILESPNDKGKSPADAVRALAVGTAGNLCSGDAGASRRPSKAHTHSTMTSSGSGTMSPRSVLGKRGEYDDEMPRLPTPTDSSPTANSSTLNLLKQSLKLSLNFAEQTFGGLAKRSTPTLAVLNLNKPSPTRGSWADEVIRAGTIDCFGSFRQTDRIL